MKITIDVDDETHSALVKIYTNALAAEVPFTFDDYLIYLLQTVTLDITHEVQRPVIKEKIINEQKILRFRGKEYLEQNFVVHFECDEIYRDGKIWRAPGVYRQRVYKDGTSQQLGKYKIPEWHCLDHPGAIVHALETETLKENPDLK